MAARPNLPSEARIALPPASWGGEPQKLLDAASLRVRERISEGVWRIRTEEGYGGTAPDLVRFDTLAGPTLTRPRFDRVEQWVNSGVQIEPLASPGVQTELSRRVAQIEQHAQLVDAVSYMRLALTTAPSHQIQEVIEKTYADLLNYKLEGSGDIAFPSASVHLIAATETLRYRLKLISFLLRFEYDKELHSGDDDAAVKLKELAESGALAFQSSQAYLDGTVLFDAYVGPALGALTPAIWAFASTRSFGVVLHSLGSPLSGLRPGQEAELLQTLPLKWNQRVVEYPELTAKACAETFDWFAIRLNRMFGVLTDPAIFTLRGEPGQYSPLKHLHAILSVEQIFRRTLSIQASHRDDTARQALLFTVLDTIEHLTGWDIETTCDLAHAEKVLSLLRNSMSSEAGSLLLHSAERGVEALRRVQEGLFIARQSGSEHLEYSDQNGRPHQVPLGRASAYYIKLLRDATHGHGDSYVNRAPRSNALLAGHNGDLPQDLPLLGYMYLLEVMRDSQRLATRLHFAGPL